MNMWSILDYPHALAGDLVFTTNKMRSLPIEGYQRLRRFPHPEKAHVACIVSPTDIMEAMLGEESYSLTFAEWLATRPEDEQRFVLRNPNMRHEDAGKIIDAALFYLDEKYALKDALRDTIQDTPERLGYSICSVTAGKILKRTGLVDQSLIPAGRQIFPGPLYALLLENGWQKLILGPTYFTSDVATSMPSIVQQRLSTEKSSAMMRKTMAVADDIISTFDGFLDVLPTQDTFFSIAASEAASVLDIISDQILDVVNNHARAWLRIKQGVGNWKDTSTYRQELNVLINTTRKKELLVCKLMSSLLESVEKGFPIKSIGSSIRAIHDDISDGGTLTSDQLDDVLNLYYQCELNFLAVVGMRAAAYSSQPVFFDDSTLESLGEEDRAAILEVFNSLHDYFDSTRIALGRYAKQVGNIRGIVATLVTPESMITIDDLVQNQMENILFEKVRSTSSYAMTEELRKTGSQTIPR